METKSIDHYPEPGVRCSEITLTVRITYESFFTAPGEWNHDHMLRELVGDSPLERYGIEDYSVNCTSHVEWVEISDPKLHHLAVLGKAPHPNGCLKGYCHTTYDNLVVLLGQPHTHRGDKVTVEWAFRCNDGTTFHVYDWKLTSTPQGPYDWHIGGSNSSALVAFHRFTGLPVMPLDVESYQVAYVWKPNSIFPSDAHQQSTSNQAQGQST